MKDAAFSATEFAHSLELISAKTGLSSHDLQLMSAVGKTVGLDLNDMVVATRKFSSSIIGGEGSDGMEPASTKGAKGA